VVVAGGQHHQEPPLVVVVGGEDVGDGPRRQVVLGVDLHRLALDAHLPFQGGGDVIGPVVEAQAEDVAECVLWAISRPAHVNVDEIVVKARNQSSGGRILRDE